MGSAPSKKAKRQAATTATTETKITTITATTKTNLKKFEYDQQVLLLPGQIPSDTSDLPEITEAASTISPEHQNFKSVDISAIAVAEKISTNFTMLKTTAANHSNKIHEVQDLPNHSKNYCFSQQTQHQHQQSFVTTKIQQATNTPLLNNKKETDSNINKNTEINQHKLPPIPVVFEEATTSQRTCNYSIEELNKSENILLLPVDNNSPNSTECLDVIQSKAIATTNAGTTTFKPLQAQKNLFDQHNQIDLLKQEMEALRIEADQQKAKYERRIVKLK
ncbi:hypothetical protein HK100_002544, partial [Physocladia obscura]